MTTVTQNGFFMRIYLAITRFIMWCWTHVFVNSLPDRMKRAFVISSLFARLKRVYQSQDTETYDKLNKLFSLTDGAVSLELPTRFLSHEIWADRDIEQLQAELAKSSPNLQEISTSLAKKLPSWISYSDNNAMQASDLEKLLQMKDSLNF